MCEQVVCVCKLCGSTRRPEADGGGRRRTEADGGGRDAESKTRTVHKEVGKKQNENQVKCQNQNLRHIHCQMVCQKLCQPGVSRRGSFEMSSFCTTFENQVRKIIFWARVTNQPTPAEFSEYSGPFSNWIVHGQVMPRHVEQNFDIPNLIWISWGVPWPFYLWKPEDISIKKSIYSNYFLRQT